MPTGHTVNIPPRIPLVIDPENRDGSTGKDAALVNCYCEKDPFGNFHIYRRPGMKSWGNPSGISTTGQGCFYWNHAVYSIFLVPIGSPITASVSASSSGGTLAANTYFYVVAALDSTGKVVVSSEMSVTTTGSTSSVTVNFTFPASATNCYVYRGTTAGYENVAYSVLATATSFLDTGAAGVTKSPPITDGTHTGALYKNLSATGYQGIDPTGGVYSFSSILGASPKMVFQNGSRGYAYDDTSGVSATLHALSPSYPQYTVKGLAYLDGTTYVCQHFFGTSITPAVIWGSGINDVTTPDVWDPLNFITAQIESDSGVYLAKQLVYVVCLKEWTTEVFFDAGNATGSPLGAVMNAKLNWGCASADSVQNINDALFFISTNRSASNQVLMVDRLQPTVVSTPEIDRLLELADLSTVYSWQIKLNGHSFYILTVKNNNLTLAYDISQNKWSRWTDANGNYVPIVCSTRDTSGNHILQHESNGILYYSNSTYRDDNGALIPITVVTPNFDAGTRRQKQLGMLGVISDQIPGCLMSISYSDDDYQTWSMSQVVNLGEDYPMLTDLGTFRKRAFKLQVSNNSWFRVIALETQFDIATL